MRCRAHLERVAHNMVLVIASMNVIAFWGLVGQAETSKSKQNQPLASKSQKLAGFWVNHAF